MPASDSLEASALDLYFLNTADSNIGDASGLQPSGTAGSFYIALHTASPGESGNQTTNEATYTSYARVAVARTGSGWSRTANVIANAAAVSFPACTGGSNTITYFSVGTASSGTGRMLWYGALTSSLAVSSGITPSFAIGSLTVSND